MKLRSLYTLAASLGLAAGTTMAAPTADVNPNQKLAGEIAQRLDAHGLGSEADVSIKCEGGTVTLTGTAQSAAIKEKVLHETRFTPGVKLVRDGVEIKASKVVTAQASLPMTPVQPLPVNGGNGGALIEPAPLGAPGMHTPDMQAPPLPPYAWPTYAPYNNVSRVAYPEAYPYNAFPFIGPYYPFPKVPLGWRKVVLEWDDGHWYMGRASTPHDYWRVKFW